jgi:transcriptional regulator with XRE-family HTH domain
MKLEKKEVCAGVGKRIREIRLLHGLTLEKLANDANIDYSQLSRIELGKINTSIYQVYQIAYYLQTPVKEFFKDLK